MIVLAEAGDRRRSVVEALRRLADQVESEMKAEPYGFDCQLQFADGETYRRMCYEPGFNHAVQVGILMCQVDHHIAIMKGSA